MNFYNPYFYAMPAETSGISSFLGKLSFSSILNGTSKTLNFVNQAIPVVKQVSPMMKNLKTMFNVMNEFKKSDIEKNSPKTENIVENNNVKKEDNGPTFFI